MGTSDRLESAYLQQQIDSLLARVATLESDLSTEIAARRAAEEEQTSFEARFEPRGPEGLLSMEGDQIATESFRADVSPGLGFGLTDDEDERSFLPLVNESGSAISDDVGNILLALIP